MSVQHKIPPYRSLDIYRLVVVRQLKQCAAARSFNLTPGRISQVVRRVRQWVNHSLGDWLFPGRDDLRFYVALEIENIRVHESEIDPETVHLVGPRWSYTRQPTLDSSPDRDSAKTAADFSAQPINSNLVPADASTVATSSAASDSVPDHINDLASRLAQLLILWKKSRKFTAALISPR